MTSFLGKNQHIFTFEDDEWMMRGHYDYAIKNNEELVWSEINGERIAQILIVCNFN